MNKTENKLETKISTEVAILEQYFKKRIDLNKQIEQKVDELALITSCIIRQETKIKCLQEVVK